MFTPPTVVVVDDSPETRELVAQASAGGEWTFEPVADLSAAEARIEQGCCDVVITGLGTSAPEELQTLRRLRRRHPHVKMIVLADAGAPEAVLEAVRAHAFSYFSRPFSVDELRAMLRLALAEPDWNDGLELVSDSQEWISVRARARRVTADRLVRFLDEMSGDLSDEDRQSLGQAFREILLNAVEHGGALDAENLIEITRIRTAGLILYMIRDSGKGFDRAALPHAAVSNPADPVAHVDYRARHGMRAGGFGLLIARGLVDELLHNSAGNEALLIKRLT